MDMINRVPDWVTPVAWTYIALSLLAAAYIAFDIYARRHRHLSTASELVWITSALYLGPFAVPLHHLHIRRTSKSGEATTHQSVHDVAGGSGAGAGDVAAAGLPGGSASAVAHLVGVPLVIASGLTIAGIDLWVMILTIGVLAMAFLFVYERTASRRTGKSLSVRAALTAAVLTVLAFDVGMGGWMLLLHFNEYMPPATEGSFWFLMQIGIIFGLLTGYPVVNWLTRRHQTVAAA